MKNIIEEFEKAGYETIEISNLTGIRSLRLIRKIKEGIESAPYSLIFLLMTDLRIQQGEIVIELDQKKIHSLKLREITLKPSKDWEHPTAEEIKKVCDSIGKSSEVGCLVGATGSNIRKFIGGHKPIPYSIWALLCYEAGIGVIWREEKTI